MSYFAKVEDPENPGQYIFQEVLDADVVLPDEVLKAKVYSHPAYKQVVEESKQRKERVRALREQLVTLEGAGNPEKPDGEPAAQPPATPTAPVAEVKPIDEEALFKSFRARMQQEEQEAAKARAEANARLEKIAKDNGLGTEAISLLANAVDPAAMAAALARANYRFDDAPAGEIQPDAKEALLGSVFKKLNLGD